MVDWLVKVDNVNIKYKKKKIKIIIKITFIYNNYCLYKCYLAICDTKIVL